jgi:hypothetical protein
MKAQRSSAGITLLSLTSALDGGGWSTPRAGRFAPKKETRYSLCRGLAGPHGRSGRVRKLSLPTCSELPHRILFQTGSRVFHIGLRSPQGLYVHGATHQYVDTAAPWARFKPAISSCGFTDSTRSYVPLYEQNLRYPNFLHHDFT